MCNKSERYAGGEMMIQDIARPNEQPKVRVLFARKKTRGIPNIVHQVVRVIKSRKKNKATSIRNRKSKISPSVRAHTSETMAREASVTASSAEKEDTQSRMTVA